MPPQICAEPPSAKSSLPDFPSKSSLAYLAVAVMLLVKYVRDALEKRSKKSWTAVASIPSLLAVLLWVNPLIARFVVYAEFAVMLPAYSRIVDAVTEAPSSGQLVESPEAMRYIVDNGPPVRVAFPQFGIIDNWSGIIYDPSDAVALAAGWRFGTGERQFTAPPEIRTLFGGDLVSCWRLYRHFYSCSFT